MQSIGAPSGNVEAPLTLSAVPRETLLRVLTDMLPAVEGSKFVGVAEGDLVDWQDRPLVYRAIVLPFVDEHDEVGTPICITVDFQTIDEDDTVTVRDRDTMAQRRVAVAELPDLFREVIR